MKTTIEFVFFLTFYVSVLMGILSYMNCQRFKSKEFMHLSEFWASLAVMTIISYLFKDSRENLIGFSLIGWIWPMKTIMQIAQDISGLEFINRTKVIIIGAGTFLSLALASYQFPLIIYSTPFCLSIGIVGGMILFTIFKHNKREHKHLSILENTTYLLLGLFFLVRMLFPLWRMSDINNIYGFTTHLMIFIGLAASTPSLYMEVMKVRHEKQLESILKERNDQLFGQAKYAELGMMSAGIAHEINNPLAIIQAKITQLMRLLRDPKRQQEVSEGLEQILYTSERINRTIQGVREFIHQDERVPNEEISLKDLVDDVMAFTGQRMKNHGVNLRFYGLENYKVRGNKIQLEQVILNLLNNSFDAIEFLPDKWIEMTVLENKGKLQIYFKDSGPGIAPEVAARIMEPFFTTKKIGKGTGLGLALARGIMEKHGGSLVYVSNANHTTFLLELPKSSSTLPTRVYNEPVRPQLH